MLLLVLGCFLCTTSTTAVAATRTSSTTALFDSDWELLETYPHDPTSFTQGLEVHPSSSNTNTQRSEQSCPNTDAQDASCSTNNEDDDERLWLVESTGMHGASKVRIWDPIRNTVVRETKLSDRFFGEGSTVYVDENANDGNQEKIAVLTWQEQTILVYNAETLELVETIHPWPSPTTTREGWGIAFDPESQTFCVSDGSEYLHFWNTRFEELRKVPVALHELVKPSGEIVMPRPEDDTANNGRPVRYLNELEWDWSTNTLLANVWFQSIVLRIDPTTGVVTKVYDFSKLAGDNQRSNEDVFNGIAILPFTSGKEWLVTGKYWKNLYKIQIRD